jgi:hypothetical protein
LAIRRRPGRKTVVTPVLGGAEAALPTRADPTLVKALARAFRYQRMLDEGRHASISEMARAEGLDRGYMGRILQLTLLAPDLVEAILDGRQAVGGTAHVDGAVSGGLGRAARGESGARAHPDLTEGCTATGRRRHRALTTK